MKDDIKFYLEPTPLIDCDHPAVFQYAQQVAEAQEGPIAKAISLYLAVRDSIRYDPYSPFHLPHHYRASYVLQRGHGFCVPKASLLCALGRASGIPSRVGFATVRNHLATRQLIDFLGSDLFVYHGFVEFHLEGRWVKATPAFNRELCELHNVPPLEFNGVEDSVFQPYNLDRRKFMDYVEDLGSCHDIPLERILEAWKKVYGEDFIERAARLFRERGDASFQDFEQEEVWNG